MQGMPWLSMVILVLGCAPLRIFEEMSVACDLLWSTTMCWWKHVLRSGHLPAIKAGHVPARWMVYGWDSGESCSASDASLRAPVICIILAKRGIQVVVRVPLSAACCVRV